MKRNLALIAVAVMLTACHHTSRPSGVMSPIQMADFLTEAYLMESYNSFMHPGTVDSLSKEITEAYTDLLKRHDLTQEMVEKSMDYYGHHPDQYEKILSEVTYRLENEETITFK